MFGTVTDCQAACLLMTSTHSGRKQCCAMGMSCAMQLLVIHLLHQQWLTLGGTHLTADHRQKRFHSMTMQQLRGWLASQAASMHERCMPWCRPAACQCMQAASAMHCLAAGGHLY